MPTTLPPFVGRWGGATDTGGVRSQNEDSYRADAPLFLVADGMGGHDAGDKASAMVIEAFASLGARPWVSEADVREGVARARHAVVEYFRDSGRSGGSTLTGMGVSRIAGEPAVVLVNIGDSRTYRLSGGRFEQLSKDHSVVQDLIDKGRLRPADALNHPDRNVVTRAISPTANPSPDVWSVPARVGDRFLACSDGLTGELSDLRIAQTLRAHTDAQEAASCLVALAAAGEGRDNITAVVLDVVEVHPGR